MEGALTILMLILVAVAFGGRLVQVLSVIVRIVLIGLVVVVAVALLHEYRFELFGLVERFLQSAFHAHG